MKNKKFLAVFLSCAMAAGVLSGCGGTAAAGTEASKTAETTTPVETVAAATDAAKGEQVVVTALIQQSRNYSGLQKMIEKLEKEENIKIDAQIVPDEESLNMIKMKLNSGECPDIIDYNIPAVYDIIDPESNFADMTGEEWIDRLVILENVTAKDGKIYGFPF